MSRSAPHNPRCDFWDVCYYPVIHIAVSRKYPFIHGIQALGYLAVGLGFWVSGFCGSYVGTVGFLK